MKKLFSDEKNKILVAVIFLMLMFLISTLGLFDGIDHMLTDRIYQRPEVINNDIKIIAIDEKTLAEIGAYDTWDRQYFADLINRLYEDDAYAPSLMVLDVIFQGEKDSSSDDELALAAQHAGNVVCAANVVFTTSIDEDENGHKYVNRLHPKLIEYPFDSLGKVTQKGFANSMQDESDSFVREFYPVLPGIDGDIDCLSLSAAKLLAGDGSLDINIPETKSGEKLLIKYSGNPGDYEVLSFADVLNGVIPKEIFKDSILFVGAYAPGLMDAYSVPVNYGRQMYGVEIHANIFESITNGRYMQNANKWIYSLIFAIVVFIYMIFARKVKPLVSAALGVIIIAGSIAIGFILSQNHIFVPLLGFVIVIIAGYITSVAYSYISEYLKRQRVLKAFRKYVAPQVVDEISKKGSFKVSVGGSRRSIAVLFVDIRGFTPLSESLEPEQVVAILDEYLALTTEAIFKNLGTLDKFVGDAVMAVFNSPFDLDDYIYRAVCTARDIMAGAGTISKKAFELTGKNVNFGIGVNCGDAVVGNIGCDVRMDYTAIGDTVNTAARLEANAAAGQILLSQAVVDALPDRIEVKPVGEISLKGKSIPLMVYELVNVK